MAHNSGRVARVDEIDGAIGAWTAARAVGEVLALLTAADVPVGKVYTAADIALDAHYQARDMLLEQTTREGRTLTVPGIVPKLLGTPGQLLQLSGAAPGRGHRSGAGRTGSEPRAGGRAPAGTRHRGLSTLPRAPSHKRHRRRRKLAAPCPTHHTLGTQRFAFADLRELLAKAGPRRSGDELAGLAAASAQERVAAQCCLAELPLRRFLSEAVVPYEQDEVTRLIVDGHDAAAFAPVAHLTVGDFRDWLLSDAATPAVLAALAPGLTPEMVAAVSKLCRLQDLLLIARKCEVRTQFRSTLGLR